MSTHLQAILDAAAQLGKDIGTFTQVGSVYHNEAKGHTLMISDKGVIHASIERKTRTGVETLRSVFSAIDPLSINRLIRLM